MHARYGDMGQAMRVFDADSPVELAGLRVHMRAGAREEMLMVFAGSNAHWQFGLHHGDDEVPMFLPLACIWAWS
jgi:hypothetical protein